jgi:deazaflavin-dependent oxidoreductase (nitroreductase family)
VLFGQEHVDRYRETDGAEGHEWRGTQTLLLTTTGRRSGERRTTPLIYAPHGEDAYTIVASKGGSDTPPAWYLNLEQDPDVEVQVKGDRFKARARTATAEEKAGHVEDDGGRVARLRRVPAADRARDPGRRAGARLT